MRSALAMRPTISGFFALTVSAGFINRLAALPEKLAKMGYINLPTSVTSTINTIGTVVFFAIIIVFALWVFWCFFSNFNQLKAEEVH